MDTESVAYVYATALSQVEETDLKKVEEEMSAVAAVFKDSDIKSYFESPKIPTGEKKENFKKAFGDKLSPLVMNFLYLLVDKRRDDQIPAISAALTDIADKEFGRVRPHIVLSRKYSEAEIKEITSMVENMISTQRKDFGLEDYKKDLEFIPEIEYKPEMLGGVYLRVGDYMVDFSISRYLKDWKTKVLSGPIGKEAIIND